MLTPSFQVSQQIGLNSTVRLTDTSTGSDGAITSRVAFLQKADGTFAVPDGTSTQYVVWDYADASIDIDCLDKDRALQITVEWLDVNGAILYTSTGLYGLTGFNEDFDYTLTSVLASNPLLINDNSFKENKTNLRLFIDSGDQAVTRSTDIVSAQQCYDQATILRVGSEYFFNESTS